MSEALTLFLAAVAAMASVATLACVVRLIHAVAIVRAKHAASADSVRRRLDQMQDLLESPNKSESEKRRQMAVEKARVLRDIDAKLAEERRIRNKLGEKP